MNIGAIMKKYGVSKKDLAAKMGVSLSAVSQTISGNPTAEKLKELAGAIGCERWEFFEDEFDAAMKRKNREPRRVKQLQEYTPAELVKELERRGYEGTMTRTESYTAGKNNQVKEG